MSPGRSRARTRGQRGRGLEVLAALGPRELRAALECVLAVHSHLRSDIGRIATALSAGAEGRGQRNTRGSLSDVDAIARQLQRVLVSLDTLDLGHKRRHRFEDGDDADEVWDRLHQAVAPSVEAMVRLVRMGREGAGLCVMQGILLGLYRVREGKPLGELLAAAPDFPDETAAWAWQTWRRASRGRPALPEDFVRRHLPEWTWLFRRR